MRTRPPKFTPVALLLALAGCPSTDHVVGSTTAASGDTGSGYESETAAPETGTETGDGDVVEDHRTFFIGESNHFDGGGACDNTYVLTVTSSLKGALLDAGWTGLRFVDDDSWPEDFRESTFSDQRSTAPLETLRRSRSTPATATSACCSGDGRRTTARARTSSTRTRAWVGSRVTPQQRSCS